MWIDQALLVWTCQRDKDMWSAHHALQQLPLEYPPSIFCIGGHFDEVTDTFVHLSLHPFEILNAESSHCKRIETMIVVIYDRTSPLNSVNATRENYFFAKETARGN